MFAAGDKMGKNALTSAWFNYFKLPFGRSVRVAATLAPRAGSASPPKPGVCIQLCRAGLGFHVGGVVVVDVNTRRAAYGVLAVWAV